MARLATAKKPAASVSTSQATELGSPPRNPRRVPAARVSKSTRTAIPALAVAPVLDHCQTPSLESEFMQAMQEYKKRSGRMFPTWSEVLEVLQSLGYRKIEAAGSADAPRLTLI
ncbi:hypothetical protein SAMN05444166_2348 [Singulisphaera sp. GP187]|uniref:hypothetical protein n=1 Tax=Singulisphaera sp. GP187 TaxID=1882752 RepID=UPI000926017C|nr:hypothetical protein [Singulisphaera sp. GP187]SIO08067.1 hypothetical protein SAMN05444166_2348 [Singulisphaera sp. GP187]